MSLTRAMLGATYGILIADIFIREGPVMGSYEADLIAMGLFLGMLYINRKLDKGHDEVILEIRENGGLTQFRKLLGMLKEVSDAESMDRPGEQEGSDTDIGQDSGTTTGDSGVEPETDPSGLHGLERIQ